jgi:ABC-type proline/glycine betaine transport system permease subunit
MLRIIKKKKDEQWLKMIKSSAIYTIAMMTLFAFIPALGVGKQCDRLVKVRTTCKKSTI